MSAYRYPAPTQQQQYTQYDPTMTSNPFAEFEATGTGGDEVDDDYVGQVLVGQFSSPFSAGKGEAGAT